MLLQLVLDKCTNHAAIHFFNDDFRKAFIRRPFTNPVDDLLYSVRCTHGCLISFKRRCSFNALSTLSYEFDQLTVYLIDMISDISNRGIFHEKRSHQLVQEIGML